jgi:hypothetical protein
MEEERPAQLRKQRVREEVRDRLAMSAHRMVEPRGRRADGVKFSPVESDTDHMSVGRDDSNAGRSIRPSIGQIQEGSSG